MKSTSKRFVRPRITPFGEDADSAGVARIYVEVDAGAGQHVTLDIKIAVHSRIASDFAPVVGELATPSAELWDEHSPDQQLDDPEYGPYIFGLFGEPVRMRRPKRGWRRFGRRR
jgi:hypothetical protein